MHSYRIAFLDVRRTRRESVLQARSQCDALSQAQSLYGHANVISVVKIG